MTDNTQEINKILDRYLDSQWNGNMRNEILDWHNKQTLELLDRLIAQQWRFGERDDSRAVPTRYIEAERNKLKESNNGN